MSTSTLVLPTSVYNLIKTNHFIIKLKRVVLRGSPIFHSVVSGDCLLKRHNRAYFYGQAYTDVVISGICENMVGELISRPLRVVVVDRW